MRMGHVTIRTEFFEQEIGFYESIVGLKIVADMRGRGSDIVFLADKDEDTRVEIIREAGAVNSGNEKISIGFETEDVEKLRQELTEKGLEVGPIISPAPVVRFFFVTDPAGVSIQFITQS